MFRLTREVRFAVNGGAGEQCRQLDAKPTNGYAGFPSLTGLGHYFALQLTLAGSLDPDSQYLLNIRDMDAVVRDRAISLVEAATRSADPSGHARLIASLFQTLRPGWADGITLDSIRLPLSPFLSVACLASELPMVRLSQKFEFSATHRLHNPALTEQQNQAIFGKCNNPHGHGHNYEIQVTLAGTPDDRTGLLIDVPRFEEIVGRAVIDRYDHRNLNVELPEFRETIPTVENIAAAVYRLLKPKFDAEFGGEPGGRARLAAVTVWETPKTWCEYSE